MKLKNVTINIGEIDFNPEPIKTTPLAEIGKCISCKHLTPGKTVAHNLKCKEHGFELSTDQAKTINCVRYSHNG